MRAVCAVATMFAAGAQGAPSGSAAPVYTMMGSDSPTSGFRSTAAPNAAVGGGVTPGMGASNSPIAGFRGTVAPNAAMGASNSPSAGMRPATVVPTTYPTLGMAASNSPSAGFRGTAAPHAAVGMYGTWAPNAMTPGMGASNSPSAGFRGTATPNAAVGTPNAMTPGMGASNSPSAGMRPATVVPTTYPTVAGNGMTPGMGASNSPSAGLPGMGASNSPSAGMRPATVVPTTYPTVAGNGMTPGMGASNSPSAGMRPATVVPTFYPTVAGNGMTPGMGASNSPTAGVRGTVAPNVAMGASNSPTAGVRGTVAPNVAVGATNSPTAGVRATSNPSVASPQGTRAPTGCQNEQTFHAKDCPQCSCAWFEQDPANRCTKYGKAQGAVRSADGKWHNANKACCVCKNYHAAPATASPTAGPVPQVPAGPGVGGCHDYRGDNQKGDGNAAFSIKGCPDCTCEWMSRAGRCGMYGKYSGAIRDSANKKWLKASEACCVCDGGAH